MPDEVKDQIDAMLDIDNNVDVGVDEPEDIEDVEPDDDKSEPESEPDTEDAPDESEAEETDAEDEDEADDTKSEPDTSEADEDNARFEKLKGENETLRTELNKVYEKNVADAKNEKTEKEPDIPKVPDEIDFLGEYTDIDDLMRDPSSVNKILNKVYQMGSDASKKFQETTLRNIPEIVKSNIVIQATLKDQVNKFYGDNEDLKPFKKVVAAVYEEVASENPDWKITDVFSEVEKETRKRLELHKQTKDNLKPDNKAQKPKPNFPKTKSSRARQKPNTNRLISEIDKMNEVL